MKCFHPDCTKAAPHDTLFRMNAKGVPGIWGCWQHKHLTDKKPDPQLDAVVSELERTRMGEGHDAG